MLLTSVSLVSFNQFLYKNVPIDPLKDFTFVAPVADAGFVLVASTESGIKSWADLVKRAKAQPDGLTFASAGLGNSTHLYPEMIALRSGLKLRHIPYKSSGPALMAVVSSETDLMTVTTVGIAQIKAGKVVRPRAIGRLALAGTCQTCRCSRSWRPTSPRCPAGTPW